MVATSVLLSATTFYGLSMIPACFLCCITPLLMDDTALGMRAEDRYGAEEHDEAQFDRDYADLMLVVSSLVCLWLYPIDVFLSVSFAWACHAVYLCEAMWLPEHLLLVLPFAHIVCFLVICCLMACAYRDRSQRRFKAACDRAKLFQEDPQAFFREKKYRGGGAAAPRVDVPDV